ncbi:MAG TPA: hypothetical protein VGQ86_10610, partial [Candidatus Limnocylindria bacterium]|nr:hypothetical protein [Candidatus Limnocylindria bacterium]
MRPVRHPDGARSPLERRSAARAHCLGSLGDHAAFGASSFKDGMTMAASATALKIVSHPAIAAKA